MTYYSGQTDLEYYPSGTIKSYITLVSDEFQVGGQFIKVAERSKITFYPNGNIRSVYLADDTKLSVGKQTKRFHENDRVDFLEDGNLNMALGAQCEFSQDKEPSPLLAAALKFLGIL